MRVHAIQTGTVVIKEAQRSGGRGSGLFRLLNTLADRRWTEPLPIYAWLIEHPEGAIVIDTGDTAFTAKSGYFPWWQPYFRLGLQMFVRPEEEIGPRLKKLGFTHSDVRWLLMTHLHTDHAGGLYHFPDVETFVSRKEYETASGWIGRINGFLPHRWPSWFAPKQIDFTPRPFGPFPESATLTRAGDVHVVFTPGHTAGHMSVILEAGDITYFFAGDASYNEGLMMDQVVDGVTFNPRVAKQTLDRILAYVKSTPTVYLPSHDPGAAGRLAEKRIVT